MNISAAAGKFKAFAGYCVTSSLPGRILVCRRLPGQRGDVRLDVNGMLSQVELLTGSVNHEA